MAWMDVKWWFQLFSLTWFNTIFGKLSLPDLYPIVAWYIVRSKVNVYIFIPFSSSFIENYQFDLGIRESLAWVGSRFRRRSSWRHGRISKRVHGCQPGNEEWIRHHSTRKVLNTIFLCRSLHNFKVNPIYLGLSNGYQMCISGRHFYNIRIHIPMLI